VRSRWACCPSSRVGLQRNTGAWAHQVDMTTMSRPPDLLTVEEAAAWLRAGRTCAYQLCRRFLATSGADGIPCIRVGRLLRVPRHLLEQRFGISVSGVPFVDGLAETEDTENADQSDRSVVAPLVRTATSSPRGHHPRSTHQPSLPFRK
jgi:hypothetical protein